MSLPDEILESFNYLLDAHQTFVQDIDEYLHDLDYEDPGVDELETWTMIVETCPEFLSSRDHDGRLPCHHAALNATSSSHMYLKLFTDVGRKHKIGGYNSRGGLLVPDNTGENALNCLTDPQLFDVFRNMNPPLFFTEDIRNYNLIFSAVRNFGKRHDLVQYFCDLDPSCLYRLSWENMLPIHYAVMSWRDRFLNKSIKNDKVKQIQDLVYYLLRSSVSHFTSDESVGGLFTSMSSGTLLIDYLVRAFGMNRTWYHIETALSGLSGFPILFPTIKHSPQNCAEVITRFPNSVYERERNNRLPIHLALESGMKWSLELLYLISASQEHLKDIDPVTKWPPFMLAGIGTSCDLRTIYSLLRKNPEHVQLLKDSSGYISTTAERSKKRKLNE